MTSAEGVRSHLDLSGGTAHGVMLPIHWATFNLAPHPWSDPGEGTLDAAHRSGVQAVTPLVGQPFEPADAPAAFPWWREVAVTPTTGWSPWPPPAPAQKDQVADA